MISQTAEYALRAMVFLALHESAATGQEVANATKVPAGYLRKIMQRLAKAKIVISQRGIGGGFVLARKPDKISILDVVNAVDPIKRLTTCPLEIAKQLPNLCPLHKRLSDATTHVEKVFSSSLLSDLITESRNSLCIIPLDATPAIET